MVPLASPGRRMSAHPLACLEPTTIVTVGSLEDRLRDGHFGKLRNLNGLPINDKLREPLGVTNFCE